ncbi:MFS transporter [Burkholderia ubonensis]|uniref:MFS transporter n=1 Tax=Burkholderia ubonensis TaxID=101571 RepID=UPI000AADF29C|nr:MFS transporter [Burkholderia ubonensis]
MMKNSMSQAGERSFRGPAGDISAGTTFLFAAAVAVIALNLYASQSLGADIGRSFGVPATLAGLVTTACLLGYAIGLFFVVPLTDLIDNKYLLKMALFFDVLALVLMCVSMNFTFMVIVSFVSGVTTSATQLLVPMAGLLSSEQRRGRVVGNVVSGLMLGFLLSRPLASIATDFAGWRSFYALLACLVACVVVVIVPKIPARSVSRDEKYFRLIGSVWMLLVQEKQLRRRALYQALCMVAFGMFWTSIALRLAQSPFNLGKIGIAMVTMSGVAGVFVAPMAGRLGDRGLTTIGTIVSHLLIIFSMLLAAAGGWLVPRLAIQHGVPVGLGLLVLSALVLDAGVIGDQTLGRRVINLLRPEIRGRVNGAFVGVFMVGGAIGSAISGWAWVEYGWLGVCVLAALFGLLALLAFVGELVRERPAH